MKPEMLRAIENHPVIKQYLANIPENVWDILLPESVDDLTEFSSDIRSCLTQGEEREFIMKVQLDHGLPLRPNASVRDTVIAVRIEHLRRKRRRLKSQPPSDENPPLGGDNGVELA
jgi:hypothetical protein